MKRRKINGFPQIITLLIKRGPKKNIQCLTGETRNHFPFIKTFSILRQVLLAHVYTQSCSFGISYVARPKNNGDGCMMGVPWVFWCFSLWWFFGWFVGCWTCMGSKTQKLTSVKGNMFACITWRPMVGLKQRASWWFWRFFHCCPKSWGRWSNLICVYLLKPTTVGCLVSNIQHLENTEKNHLMFLLKKTSETSIFRISKFYISNLFFQLNHFLGRVSACF